MNADKEIIAAYQEWAAAYDALELAVTEAEIDAASDVVQDVEAKVLSFAPTTARGLAIQITVFTDFFQFDLDASRTFDMKVFVEAIAAIKRPETFPSGEGRDAA